MFIYVHICIYTCAYTHTYIYIIYIYITYSVKVLGISNCECSSLNGTSTSTHPSSLKASSISRKKEVRAGGWRGGALWDGIFWTWQGYPSPEAWTHTSCGCLYKTCTIWNLSYHAVRIPALMGKRLVRPLVRGYWQLKGGCVGEGRQGESVLGCVWPLVDFPPHCTHLHMSGANDTLWVIFFFKERENTKDMKLGRPGGVGGSWWMCKMYYKHK